MGPTEVETWQPGKVISSKINTNHTYLATTNYWAPLDDKIEVEETSEQIKIIETKQSIANTKGNKWMRRVERRRAMKLVIDSGATSHFVPEEMDLPRKGK